MEENVTFMELLEIMERNDDVQNAVIITKTEEGHIDMFYNGLNGLEVLGMIEVGKEIALDVVLED